MKSTIKMFGIFLFVSLMLGGLSHADDPKPSEPEENFEALWKTFNERYAFFELRGVDWQTQYEIFRPKVSASTSDEELFAIFCEMLKPLKDAHINLKVKGDNKKSFNPEQTPRFLREFNSNKLLKQFSELVKQTLTSNGFEPSQQASELLLYSRSDTYGYLLITEFEGVSRQELDKGLNEALSNMNGIDGLIVDIRLNPGGTDRCVYQIARRFADKKRVGHHRKTKVGPGKDDFTELKTRHLEPKNNAEPNTTFTGPIALLTHGASYSAADVFAMLMADLPHVTVIGEPTHGIFSNMLERKLPNGWKYTLSHQVYYAADKSCYEGCGVPVDIQVLNRRTDLDEGSDPLITKALEVLSEQTKEPQPAIEQVPQTAGQMGSE